MKYPIGVQSFEKIRTEGFVYVDKTKLIYKLTEECNYVFLGRPRRFGKSLLMSTIQSYFEGRKDLFNGLEIEKLATDWSKHPVIHFDLNVGEYGGDGIDAITGDIKKVLSAQLLEYETIYGYEDDTLPNRFMKLIKHAYEATGKKVVVLIDEYDKPILATMNKAKEQDIARDILKSFYSCLKTCDRYIRFGMLTGVSKFGRLSVFSDLNNVEDLSLNKEYAAICGLTEDEIVTTFKEEIAEFAEDRGVSQSRMVEDLRLKYDGYRFSKAETLVYNPFSLLNSIKNKELRDYWFESGTPTFLVKLLQKNDYSISKIEGVRIDGNSLYRIDDVSAIPILYQSGYLTIKDYNPDFHLYTLGYPNQEVENAFLTFLLPYYSRVSSEETQNELYDLINNIKDGDIESFMTHLKSIFYSIPYAHDMSAKVQEDHVRNITYLLFKLLGFQIQTECTMSKGRSDAVVLVPDHIFIFEFKINSTPEAALKQIIENGYAQPYASDGRQISLIGVNYSTKERSISGWQITPF